MVESETAVPPPAAAQVEFPERPRLADGVVLAGVMTESAYKDPPYIVELRQARRYVQLPELLYRLAERCDGNSTVDEIRLAVSERLQVQLTDDNIRELLSRLMVLGVVAPPEGVQLPVEVANSQMLALNLKMRMLPGRFIDPLAAAFQWVFWPPVVIAVACGSLAIQVWLFFLHGLGTSVRDALYVPGAIGVLLAIIVLAAAWHEFGHAAALRYGGGRSAGMGVGLYIVYPAFYTDVTDNYRLGRWARVRTDLGGVYFHLLFALAITGLYALTGSEFLLLALVLIDYEIAHQLMPFIRLDGYWTLADLTGIPDFFSQMGPFLRGLLPGFIRVEGRKMAPLKWWACVVFAVYLLITLPLLGMLLFLMVRAVPRVLATGWDAAGVNMEKVSAAAGGGDVIHAAGYIGQLLLLAIPILGLLYTLYLFGQQLGRLWWRWSSPSWPRRAAGGAGGAVFLWMLGLLWFPQLPFADSAPASVPRTVRAQFVPIEPGERLTLGDLAGVSGSADEIPAATSTPTPAPETPTPSASATPSATATVTATATTTPTPAPTASATGTATASPTPSVTPRASP